MNILIVGGGGREHALAWKIRQSPRCDKLFCAPGNAGIADEARCVDVDLAPPFDFLIDFCRTNAIELVVVGPEDPLAAGVVDALTAAGIRAFGPSADGARLEGSKEFAKEVMQAAHIPTAAARVFSNPQSAIDYLQGRSAPFVIKADGLAAGKGVTVAETRQEAEAAISEALVGRRFGAAGSRILIEDYLHGVEASLLAFCDGQTVLPMDSAQDHKPVFDGDKGPNTGGMGALSPAPVLTPDFKAQAVEKILKPAMAELRRRGIDYRGVLYAGLMITAEGPQVVEFNCRFGDPEIQALIPRLENDLVEIMLACVDGELDRIELKWKPDSCVCLVAASGGYPAAYEKGKPIKGLKEAGGGASCVVFHAGTRLEASGDIVTSGGRVLGVTALGKDLEAARSLAYERMRFIEFDGMHFRTDIGFRAAAESQPLPAR